MPILFACQPLHADEEEDQHTDGDGDDSTLEIAQREVMHRMPHGLTAEERQRVSRDLVHGQVGGETQQRHEHPADGEDRSGRGAHVHLLLVLCSGFSATKIM